MEKLKPCPFCGGKDIVFGFSCEYGEIWCRGCKASIKLYEGFFFNPKDAKKYYKQRMFDAWNRRADDGKGNL
ncbi:MAG: Lar family restriction alleviation protein [Faecousia sp.]